MESFSGKVAVITAGASGMGLAMGQRFVREGMSVVLCDVDGGRLDAAVADLEAAGARVLGVEADVADPEAVERLRQAAFERFGGIDVLCNHAGVGGGAPVSSPPIDTASWRRSFDVSVFGMLSTLNCFLPHLLAQDDGHIVNTASRQGLVATPGLGPYCPSKFAVVAATEMLAAELEAQGSGVGVSVLCPGGVRTRTLPPPEQLPADVDPIRRTLMTERYAAAIEPDEVADLVMNAIRTKALYILTHSETVGWMENRLDRIRADLAQLGSPR